VKKFVLFIFLSGISSLLFAQDPPSPGSPSSSQITATNPVVNTNKAAVGSERDILRERIRAIRGNNPASARTNLGANPLESRTNPVPNITPSANTAPAGIPVAAPATSTPVASQPNIVNPTVSPLPNPNVAGALVPSPTQLVNPNAPLLNSASSAVRPGDEIIKAGEIQFNEMPVSQLFEAYGRYSGRTILRQGNLPGQITLKIMSDLTRTEVIQAFDGVLALNGVTMIPVGERFVKAVLSAQAGSEGTAISQRTPDDLPLADQFVTQIIPLKTLKPSEAAGYLSTFTRVAGGITPIEGSQVIILRDYAANVKRMTDILEKIDVSVEPDYRLEVIPIKYGKVTELYDTMSSLVGGSSGGGVSSASRSRSQTTGTLGSRATGLNRSAGGLNRGIGQQGMDNTGRISPQQNLQPNVGGNQSSFQNRINQIVNRAASGGDMQVLDDARIVPDERSNSLLVYANKRDMEMITNIVARVDTLLAQVLIEAIILEVGLDDRQDIGISYLQNRQVTGKLAGLGAVNNGQNFPSLATNISSFPGGFSYFGTYGGTLQAALTAVATDSQANIVSRPRLQTSHAVPGQFAIGETVPYVTSQSSFGLVSGGVSSQNNIQERPIEILLSVVPFITPEGLVVMDIVQKFDSRGADAKVGDLTLPIINTREVSSTLSVRDGDTIMLGGFIKEEKTKSKSGVPYLKDIPGLGVLFRSKNETKSRKEMIVLMRATILQTPEKAAFVASEERANLPGIKQAEIVLDQENQTRMKKADAEQRKKEKRDMKSTPRE